MSTVKKLKYGVIGCGAIAEGRHLPAIKAIKDGIELAAFCDIVKDCADKMNNKFRGGKGKVFTDYKELIKEDLDAVLVLTPNNSHCEISVAALNAGRHVLCEKPMAINYTEAQRMIKASKDSGKLLTVSYQNRFRSDSLHLKKTCAAGELGDIYFAKAIALRRRAVPTWGVFLDKEKQGGGPLIDIAAHSLDLTLFAMDNYEPAYCVGKTYHKLNSDTNTANMWGDWDSEKFTVEDSAFGYVVMKNGATIIIESSWALNTLNVKEAVIELCGTKGGADMPCEGKIRYNGVKDGKMYTDEPIFGNETNPSELEHKCFANAIRGKDELYIKPEQAAAVTRIFEGIYISAKTDKPYIF